MDIFFGVFLAYCTMVTTMYQSVIVAMLSTRGATVGVERISDLLLPQFEDLRCAMNAIPILTF